MHIDRDPWSRLDFLRDTTGHLRDGRLLLLLFLALAAVVLLVLSRVLDIDKGEEVGEDEKSPAMKYSISYSVVETGFKLENSPLNRRDNDQGLQSVAARVGTGTGLGDQSCQGNPAAEPQTHGHDLDEGNHEFMGDAREPEGCEAEVRDGDDGGPAAVEEHEVDDVGEGP